jgi:hypothetical protein
LEEKHINAYKETNKILIMIIIIIVIININLLCQGREEKGSRLERKEGIGNMKSKRTAAELGTVSVSRR